MALCSSTVKTVFHYFEVCTENGIYLVKKPTVVDRIFMLCSQQTTNTAQFVKSANLFIFILLIYIVIPLFFGLFALAIPHETP